MAKIVAFGIWALLALTPLPSPAASHSARVIWDATCSKNEVCTYVQDSGDIEYLAALINDNFILPRNLDIHVESCGEENAFYYPDTGEIVICQELFEYFLSLAEQFDDPDQVEQLMLDSVVFTGLHEWGHAAIDLYDIPITGREEDVADQVATWLTIEAVGENAEEALTTMLNASLLFLVQGENMADDESAYWDSHSLDMQRFYNMLCWSYGFDPDLTNKVTGEPVEEIIPEERLASCSEEYQRMFDSLSSLMADHLRE